MVPAALLFDFCFLLFAFCFFAFVCFLLFVGGLPGNVGTNGACLPPEMDLAGTYYATQDKVWSLIFHHRQIFKHATSEMEPHKEV